MITHYYNNILKCTVYIKNKNFAIIFKIQCYINQAVEQFEKCLKV